MTDAGLSETARLLAQRPPFQALAPDELAEVVAQAIEFHLRGAVILSQDGSASERMHFRPVIFLRVIHSGAVDIAHEGRLLDLLVPGGRFGHAAMLSGLPPGFEARAAEDTLCYRIPVAVARPMLDRARHRELSVGGAQVHQPLMNLIRRPTVTCQPSESIGIVAERMTAVGASCAIELDAGTIGIVTDQDLRTRVLAAGRTRWRGWPTSCTSRRSRPITRSATRSPPLRRSSPWPLTWTRSSPRPSARCSRPSALWARRRRFAGPSLGGI